MDPRPSRTRAAIRGTALRLGVLREDALTVNEVAREAGVSRASLYSHYPSGLEDVIIDLIDEFSADLAEQIAQERAREPDTSAVVPCRAGLRVVLRNLEQNRSAFRSASTWRVGSRVRERLIENLARLLFPEPVDAAAAARSRRFAAGVIGAGTVWLRDLDDGRAAPIDQVVEEQLSVFRVLIAPES